MSPKNDGSSSQIPTVTGRVVVLASRVGLPLDAGSAGSLSCMVFWNDSLAEAVLDALDYVDEFDIRFDVEHLRVAYIDARNVTVARSVSLENPCSQGVDEPDIAE
jgi:hypothetical protein